MVDPLPLKYVPPTSSEEALSFAPQSVVIYNLPSGGGGGGDVQSVNGKTGVVSLNAADVGAAPTTHTQAISTITGLQSALDTKATAADLDNTFGIANEAHENADTALGLAQTAVQPAQIANFVPNTRTVAGKPLSANVTLDKVDVGLSNVDNLAAANYPVSSAQQTALDAKVPTSRTVAGKALTSNITLAKGDVGLGNVDNTSDANKPVSSATQTALNAKVGATGLAGITAIDGPYANKAALPATGTAGVLYIYRAG